MMEFPYGYPGYCMPQHYAHPSPYAPQIQYGYAQQQAAQPQYLYPQSYAVQPPHGYAQQHTVQPPYGYAPQYAAQRPNAYAPQQPVQQHHGISRSHTIHHHNHIGMPQQHAMPAIPPAMDNRISQVHADRLRQVEEAQRLMQRFRDIRDQYFALPPEQKYTQRRDFVEHANRCSQEIGQRPPPPIYKAFSELEKTCESVSFELRARQILQALELMKTARTCAAKIKKVLDNLEASVMALQQYQADGGTKQKHQELFVRVSNIDGNFQVLHSQWQGIHLSIHQGARVSWRGLSASRTAFDPAPCGSTLYQTSRRLLQENVVEAAIAIAEKRFEDAKALLLSAGSRCEKLERLIFDLRHSVQEYLAAEARGRAAPGGAPSLILANAGPGAGKYSRFQSSLNCLLNSQPGHQPSEGHSTGSTHAPAFQQATAQAQAQAPIPGYSSISAGHSGSSTGGGRQGILPSFTRWGDVVMAPLRAEMPRMGSYEHQDAPIVKRENQKPDSGFEVHSPVEVKHPTPERVSPTTAARLEKRVEEAEGSGCEEKLKSLGEQWSSEL